jgi:hypothetical protein
MRGGRRPNDIWHVSAFEQPSREVIIETASAETASNLLPLIHGGILLGYPDTHKSPKSR